MRRGEIYKLEGGGLFVVSESLNNGRDVRLLPISSPFEGQWRGSVQAAREIFYPATVSDVKNLRDRIRAAFDGMIKGFDEFCDKTDSSTSFERVAAIVESSEDERDFLDKLKEDLFPKSSVVSIDSAPGASATICGILQYSSHPQPKSKSMSNSDVRIAVEMLKAAALRIREQEQRVENGDSGNISSSGITGTSVSFVG